MPILVIVTALFFLLSPVQAKANEEAGNNCNTYVRAGYIHSHADNSAAEKAFAIGGRFGCDLAVTDNASFNFVLYSSVDPNVNNTPDDEIQGDFFDAEKNSFILLGELALNLHFSDVEMQLGRQIFDSPHMDSDDIRMVPNLFEAYQLNWAIDDGSTIGFAYIDKMAGWENGVDQSHFVDVGQALGGDDASAYVAWGSYAIDNLALQLWAYHIHDIENIVYAEAAYSGEFDNDIFYEFAVQYDVGQDTGKATLGNIDANTWGATAALNVGIATTSVAYNHNHGHSGALLSLGGGPFYTSMEDQTLDAIVGTDAKSFVVDLEIQPYEHLVLGVARGNFHAKNKRDYHTVEYDWYFMYEWDGKLLLEGVYAKIDNHNNANADQLRLILNYHFAGI